KGHHLGFLAPGKGGENFINREFAQTDNGPSELLAGYIRNDERFLRRCSLQKCSGNIRDHQALAHLTDKPSARDFFYWGLRHDMHLSLIAVLNPAACGVLLSDASNTPDI